MTTNEVQEIFKQCTEDCKKRIVLMEEMDICDISLMDKNIETCQQVSVSCSQSALKLFVLSQELPENSELKNKITEFISILNDGIAEYNQLLQMLQEIKRAF